MSARRSHHTPSFLAVRPGLFSLHTKDLPSEKSPIWAIRGRQVTVRQKFESISTTNTPTERRDSGLNELVSRFVQAHDDLAVKNCCRIQLRLKTLPSTCVAADL